MSVLGAVSLIVSGWAPPAAAHSASSGRRIIPAGQLGGRFTASSVKSAEKVLALSGIATVAKESSTKALVTVHGPVRMRFTEAQVRSLALGAADRGGLTGSSLDSATPLPSGYPPFSYLLASWVSTSKTAAAKTMRNVMGTQNWKDAPGVVFPTIALPLFTSDVIAASPPPAASSTPSTVAKSSDYQPGRAPLSVETVGLTSAPCSTTSTFVQNVLDNVFTALQLNAPTAPGLVAKVGGFFVGIWNGAIALAQSAIAGLIQAITAPVVNVIKSAAGAAIVISDVVSYLTPWGVQVTANPSTVEAGGGGTVNATVNTGHGGASYPPSVTDCANSLGVTLPQLTTANADGVWSLLPAIYPTGAANVTLDDHGATSIGFSTRPESTPSSCSGSSGPSAPGSGSAMLTVTRPGIDDLKNLVNSMLTTGLGVAGSVVGPIVQSILSPILDTVLGQLAGLTQVTGATSVTVIHKTSPGSTPCTSTTTTTPKRGQSVACIVGTWKTTEQSAHGTPDGGAGATWTINADGTSSIDANGEAPVGGVTFTGIETATYTLTDLTPTSGTYTETPTSPGLIAHNIGPPPHSHPGAGGANRGSPVDLRGKRADDHHRRAASRGPIWMDTHPRWWLSEPPDTRRRGEQARAMLTTPPGEPRDAERDPARPPAHPSAPDAPLGPRLGHGEVICRRRFDGLINEYTRAA